jgi:hypothetical protein
MAELSVSAKLRLLREQGKLVNLLLARLSACPLGDFPAVQKALFEARADLRALDGIKTRPPLKRGR